jgi:hypothetical protein
MKRTLPRNELIAFFEKQESFTVVMKACGAAHQVLLHPFAACPLGWKR